LSEVKIMVLNILKVLIAILIASTMTGALPPSVQPVFVDIQSDQQQIQTVVVQQLTTPGLPTDANPRMTHVAIIENYAIAGWLLGEGGGEMLLTKKAGKWQVITGGGGAMNTNTLVEKGVPENIASQLVQQYQKQWQKRGQ
jgi:hypothetical protein